MPRSASPSALLALPGFSVDVDRRDRSTTVTLRGELDLATRHLADRVCNDRALLRTSVVLDLRELTFIDSQGVRILTGLDARCRAVGCSLHVIPPPSGTAARMMSLQHLERRLTYVEAPAAPRGLIAVPPQP